MPCHGHAVLVNIDRTSCPSPPTSASTAHVFSNIDSVLRFYDAIPEKPAPMLIPWRRIECERAGAILSVKLVGVGPECHAASKLRTSKAPN